MPIGRRGAIATGLLWTPALAATQSNELRVSYLEGFGFLPNLAARQRGLVEKHAAALGLPGVTVTWQSLRSAVIPTDALLAGQLDVICGTITSLLVLWDRTNGGAKVLAGLGGQLRHPGHPQPGTEDCRRFRPRRPHRCPEREARPALHSARHRAGAAVRPRFLEQAGLHPGAYGAQRRSAGGPDAIQPSKQPFFHFA
jgi:hypothetical protein